MKLPSPHAKAICALIVVLTGIFLFPGGALKASAPQQQPWYVWKKVSPCLDSRQDWFTVAQSYPGGAGSNNAWRQAFGPYTDFASAMAGADSAKMGPGFENDCCHDWAVFMRTDQSGNRTYSAGRLAPDTPGNPPQGSTVLYTNLCCEQSFNSAFGTNVGQGRDCRNLQLSTGATVTLRPNGIFEYLGGMGATKASTALNGTTLTFYQSASTRQCQSDCERNAKCKGFTWIQAGTYNANDPSMCYLLSAVTGSSSARGHTSAVKSGVSTGGSGVDGSGPGRNGNGGSGGSTTGAHWVLQSVTVTPETPPKFEGSAWSYTKQSSSAQFKLSNDQIASYQWSAPPQQMDGSGFNMNAGLQSPKFESAMSVSASGLQGQGISMEVGPVHSPSSQSKSSTFKPAPNTREFEIKVSLGYGAINFTYKYQQVQ
jgi:hypothetical protein